MKNPLLPFLVTASLCVALTTGRAQLDLALEALESSLEYMGSRVEDINLDGVLGTRLVDEQLSAYLFYEPRVMEKIKRKVVKLRDLARRISDEGMIHVQRKEPEYSLRVGNAMRRSPKMMWYPSRNTDPQMVESRLPCSMSHFNETASDGCLQNIVGEGSKVNTCVMSSYCEEMMTASGQLDYGLTHQVLYWQLAEMRNCIPKTPTSKRIHFCSNVMRDSNMIASANYPINHRDLLMEQIGLCGMWGFKDFYQPQWLNEILQWHKSSGCYGDRAKWVCTDNILPDQHRNKRREKPLDGGCLSHKTAVAVVALTVNIRFLAESFY